MGPARGGQGEGFASRSRRNFMKVLVVEDAIEAAEPLLTFLQIEGHDAQLAQTPGDALPLARSFQPDIALLDIGLPQVDGWTLGGMIRKLPGLADLPIIAVTGYGSVQDHRRSRSAGFQHHLVKPIDYPALAAILKEHEGG